jgi:hypothetical protein
MNSSLQTSSGMDRSFIVDQVLIYFSFVANVRRIAERADDRQVIRP